MGVDDVEVVEGEVTTFSADSGYNGWLRIDGERYDFAFEYSQAEVGRGSDGAFYIYNDHIVHFDGSVGEADDNYLYVVRGGSEADRWQNLTAYAEVVFADGTSEVIDLNVDKTEGKYDSDGLTDGTDEIKVASGLYSYEVEDDEYTLTTVQTAEKTSELTITRGRTKITSGGSITGNNSTVYILVTLDDDGAFDEAEVYTGYRNVPSVSGEGFIAHEDNVADYVFVVNGETTGSASDMIYIAKASVSEKIEDDDLDAEYYLYNAVVDGEIVEIMVDSAEGNELNGLYDTYTVDDDGIYSGLVPATKGEDEDYLESTGDFKKASNEVITIGKDTMAYTDDVVVYVISAKGGITEGSINRNYSDNTSIVYTVDDDGAVTALYIVRK